MPMPCNSFFRATLIAGAALGFLLWTRVSSADPPNVLLILSDDQGTLDLNCYGSSDLQTPNLDRLASQGVRFTQFYTAACVCAPSRAALLTGRHPSRIGSETNGDGLAPSEITLAELLKPAGYRTALFGKWHLGASQQKEPFAQGFDEFTGFKDGCIDNYSHFMYWQTPHFHDLWQGRDEPAHEIWRDGTLFQDIIVDEAHRFLRENQSHLFFLYLPINMPHYPMQPTERFREMAEHLAEPRRSYAAAIMKLDDIVGKVLGTLDEMGLTEKTLVIFLSDHGHSTEARANFGGGNAGRYRGSKFSFFEAGIRVPCIIRWPGHLPAGQACSQVASELDLFPTIAAACGVAPVNPLDGSNLLPLLASPQSETAHAPLHWQMGEQWAVREGPWKLLANASDTKAGAKLTGDDVLFLTNLDQDPSESLNIRNSNPEAFARLKSLHEAWRTEMTEKTFD